MRRTESGQIESYCPIALFRTVFGLPGERSGIGIDEGDDRAGSNIVEAFRNPACMVLFDHGR